MRTFIDVEVSTTEKDQMIVQDIVAARGTTMERQILRQVMDLSESAVQKALNNLGWHHESNFAWSFLVPNTPSKQNPTGAGYHFVTVEDVRKMEEQLQKIASALHL